MLGTAALAGLALAIALSHVHPAASVARGSDEGHLGALRDELRSEISSLRDDFESRLAELEASLARHPASAPLQGSGVPVYPAGDLASIRERLYNLEMRQDRQEKERTALQQDVLARLYRLEQSVQSEAAARLDNLESSAQRVERLELRLSELEGRSSGPASP